MNEIQRTIRDQIVKPMFKDVAYAASGNVLAYDKMTNTATVLVQNRDEHGTTKLDKVPVQLGSGGAHQAGPFVGDEVRLSFMDGNKMHPVIVALTSSDYAGYRTARFKHERKGAYLPELLPEGVI